MTAVSDETGRDTQQLLDFFANNDLAKIPDWKLGKWLCDNKDRIVAALPAAPVAEPWVCGTCGDDDVPENFRVFGSCYRCAAQRSIEKRNRQIERLKATPVEQVFDNDTTDWRKIAPELEYLYSRLCDRASATLVDEIMEYIARAFRQRAALVAQEPVACSKVFAWFNPNSSASPLCLSYQKDYLLPEAAAEYSVPLYTSPPAPAASVEDDWRDDPSADERWQAGLDYGMERFCSMLGVDPKHVRWDAATEELDGDVCAVIGNILRVKFGDDFDPMKPLPSASVGAAADSDHE